MGGSATARRLPPPWLVPAQPLTTGPRRTESDAGARLPALRSAARTLRRDLRAPLTALLVSWTGAFVLLWAGVLGAVLGVLVTVGGLPATSTQTLFHHGVTPGLRPWHVLDSALVGAGGTLAYVSSRIFGSPWWVVAWVAIGLTSALVALALLTSHEERLLRLRRVRRPTLGELRRLAPVAQLAGAPISGSDPARLLVMESPSATFRVHTRHVVLTTALLEGTDDRELAALLCHALHHLESGAGTRRAFVVACGWPVLLLCTLGRKVGGAHGDRGLLWAVAWLVLWPAGLLSQVVDASFERGATVEEFEADARARRAGLGDQLVTMLQTLPAAESGGGGDGAWASTARTSVALRVEQLEAGRPLDDFFGGRAAGGPGDARWWWTLAVTAATLVLLGFGALSSGGAAPANEATASATAAAYTVSYLDAVFRPAGFHEVIRRSVPSSMVTAVEARADRSPLAVASALVAAGAGTSRATALGCRTLATGRGRTVARVLVRVRWDYELSGVDHMQVTTSAVSLRLVGSRWRPTGVPGVQLTGSGTTEAAGFLPCVS